MIIQRKFKKLINNPYLFFKDMVLKHAVLRRIILSKEIYRYLRVAHKFRSSVSRTNNKANSLYSLVVTVPLKSEFFERYIRSIVRQKLDFEKSLQLILCVQKYDEYNLDVANKYKSAYPKNIELYEIEESHDSFFDSSMLSFVRNDWVAFHCADDLVDENYFLEIDKILGDKKSKLPSIVISNLLSYNIKTKKTNQSSEVKKLMSIRHRIISVSALGNMHIKCSPAWIFNAKMMHQLDMYEISLSPSFVQNITFFHSYLSKTTMSSVALVAAANYYENTPKSSLQSVSHKVADFSLKGGQFYDYTNAQALRSGGELLPIVQYNIFLELIPLIRAAIETPGIYESQSGDVIRAFYKAIDDVFSIINTSLIQAIYTPGVTYKDKNGILNIFKSEKLGYQRADLLEYDFVKNQILISFFCAEETVEIIKVGRLDVIPVYAKTIEYRYFNKTFQFERRIWVPFNKINPKEFLLLEVGGVKADLYIKNKLQPQLITVETIKKSFLSTMQRYKIVDKFKGTWLFMDRDNQADDNAEHLYRYIKENHPDQSICFVLRKKTTDWLRLENEKFNLIDFGSDEHQRALRSCEKIISSHAAQFVMDYFKDGSLGSKPFIFLQHGVIHNDQSHLFAPNKKRFDLFLTSGYGEFESIAGDYSRYKFTKKEVKLTGLPRHDALIKSDIKTEKIVLVMPTWRVSLLGRVLTGTKRELLDDFVKSVYFKSWSAYLKSDQIKSLADKYGYKFVFFPHANIQPYLHEFQLPDHIEVLDHDATSIQTLFLKSSFLVTDYSSVAFEMAILGKSTIYYQFDRDEFFSKGHYNQGYFNYIENGFGPVVFDAGELVNSTESLLATNGVPSSQYRKRMDDFFPFKDGRSCERVFKEILELDNSDVRPDNNLLWQYAKAASDANRWALAASRWRKYLASVPDSNRSSDEFEARFELLKALRMLGRFVEAHEQLVKLENSFDDLRHLKSKLEIEKLNFLVDKMDWISAITHIDQMELSDEYFDVRALCMAEAGISLEGVLEDKLMPSLSLIIYDALARRDWNYIFESLNFSRGVLIESRILFQILVRSQIELLHHEYVNDTLVEYKIIYGSDRFWRRSIARLHILSKKHTLALNLLHKLYPEGLEAMPLEDGVTQVAAKRKLSKYKDAVNDLSFLTGRFGEVDLIVYEWAALYSLKNNWKDAVVCWSKICKIFDDAPLQLCIALRNCGDIDGAYSVMTSHEEKVKATPQGLVQFAEIAQLKGDYFRAEATWVRYLSQNSLYSNDAAWARLNEARLCNNVLNY